MNILLTNDDGIDSLGINALSEAFSEEHTVWIVAPDGERSGMSHYLTMKDPIRAQKRGERSYAISGSPADCVLLAMHGALPVVPDVVLSGINLGSNLGTDVVYSGTAAAARQAAFMGVPGIALSLKAFAPPYYFAPIIAFVRDTLEQLIALWDNDHFININSPNVDVTELPVCPAVPARRQYSDKLHRYESPNGENYFFLDGAPIEEGARPGTDWFVVNGGEISVSPVALYPNEHYSLDAYLDSPIFTTSSEVTRRSVV